MQPIVVTVSNPEPLIVQAVQEVPLVVEVKPTEAVIVTVNTVHEIINVTTSDIPYTGGPASAEWASANW